MTHSVGGEVPVVTGLTESERLRTEDTGVRVCDVESGREGD